MPDHRGNRGGAAGVTVDHDAVATFISRWQRSSAAERANYQLFLTELCALLNVPGPNPTAGDESENAYVLERNVRFDHGDGIINQSSGIARFFG